MFRYVKHTYDVSFMFQNVLRRVHKKMVDGTKK